MSLSRQVGSERASGFARLWSLKEAYLKALGTGLSREPSSFAVCFRDHETAAIEDPLEPAVIVAARTTWREAGGSPFAISAVLLGGDGR